MNDADKLLCEVIAEAKSLKIPLAKNISPKVVINKRAQNRFGCCKYSPFECTIEIAEKLLYASEKACRQTLAHEVLHTCYGCRNHGARWKSYAARMNTAYGYNITRVGSCEELGVENTAVVRYILRCEKCGGEIKRTRLSKLVNHPEMYRCKCGGRLARIK